MAVQAALDVVIVSHVVDDARERPAAQRTDSLHIDPFQQALETKRMVEAAVGERLVRHRSETDRTLVVVGGRRTRGSTGRRVLVLLKR